MYEYDPGGSSSSRPHGKEELKPEEVLYTASASADLYSLHALLRGYGLAMDERHVSRSNKAHHGELKWLLAARAFVFSLPQLLVGGPKDARQLHRAGGLRPLLDGTPRPYAALVCQACKRVGSEPCPKCSESRNKILDHGVIADEQDKVVLFYPTQDHMQSEMSEHPQLKLRFMSGMAWLRFEADAMTNLLKLTLVFDAIPQMDQRLELFSESEQWKQYLHGTALISIEHMTDLREVSAKFGAAAADLEYVSSNHPIIDVQLVDSGSHGDKRISVRSPESTSCPLHVPGAGAGGEVSWGNIIGVIGHDLLIHCIHRLSRWEYGAIASLNRDFNSVVRSGDIYRLRRKNGVTEHWLYLSCNNNPHKWKAYDPSTGRWIQVPKMPPTQSSYWDSLAVGTELLVFGGYGRVALRYSILTNSWTWLADVMNNPRYWFGSASVGEKAYVAGGKDSSSGNVLSSAEMYDSEKHTWTPLPSMNRARYGCSGAFMDGKFYVIGGVSSRHEVLTCGEEYDLNRRSWRVIDNMSQGLNETIMGAPLLLAVVNSELYAADYRENNDLKQYDKLDNKWITLGKLPVRSKYKDGWDMGFRECGDRLIVIGPPNNSTDEKVVELHSWIPDEEPPVWNLVATQQFTSEGPFLYCAVMGC
ncbi:F-box/kelch-repeat protein At1g26930-like [Triticum dicoccoides]|uniref:F-box/kelch-repeat protein At1g26930-like n=1 Tax=Triticum dicoccoides TaxID=85692 RepID=UPI000E7B75A4|nr:F-box/kelch-repeat protein At1g26930-like [Triticum dicoccoides]